MPSPPSDPASDRTAEPFRVPTTNQFDFKLSEDAPSINWPQKPKEFNPFLRVPPPEDLEAYTNMVKATKSASEVLIDAEETISIESESEAEASIASRSRESSIPVENTRAEVRKEFLDGARVYVYVCEDPNRTCAVGMIPERLLLHYAPAMVSLLQTIPEYVNRKGLEETHQGRPENIPAEYDSPFSTQKPGENDHAFDLNSPAQPSHPTPKAPLLTSTSTVLTFSPPNSSDSPFNPPNSTPADKILPLNLPSIQRAYSYEIPGLAWVLAWMTSTASSPATTSTTPKPATLQQRVQVYAAFKLLSMDREVDIAYRQISKYVLRRQLHFPGLRDVVEVLGRIQRIRSMIRRNLVEFAARQDAEERERMVFYLRYT